MSELGQNRRRRSRQNSVERPLRPDTGQKIGKLATAALCQEATYAVQQRKLYLITASAIKSSRSGMCSG
jgi:hypothetical protein